MDLINMMVSVTARRPSRRKEPFQLADGYSAVFPTCELFVADTGMFDCAPKPRGMFLCHVGSLLRSLLLEL